MKFSHMLHSFNVFVFISYIFASPIASFVPLYFVKHEVGILRNIDCRYITARFDIRQVKKKKKLYEYRNIDTATTSALLLFYNNPINYKKVNFYRLQHTRLRRICFKLLIILSSICR